MAALLPLNNHDEWVNINEWISTQCAFNDPKIQVRAYHSPQGALTDHLITFAQFLSHKRTMYFQRGATPYFENIIPHLLRETIKVQNYLLDENLSTPSQQEEALKNLSTDTACIVLCANHWATREKYNLDTLLQGLESKKIFTLIVNHGDTELAKQKPSSFTAYLHAMGDINFIVLGSRWKNPTLLSWQGAWSFTGFKAHWDSIFQVKPNAELVEKFEAQFSEAQIFKVSSGRVLDRAILSFSDLNAELICHTLASHMEWDENQKKEYLATINGCDLPNYPALGSWWRPQPESKFLRGFLQISVQAIDKYPELAKTLQTTLHELRQQTSWELR